MLDPHADAPYGMCPRDNRPLEAYCTKTNMLVCASCVMFGSHKGNPVIPPENAIKMIRDSLDVNIRNGKLKVENTENFLVEIRQSKVECDRAKNKALKEADKTITDMI